LRLIEGTTIKVPNPGNSKRHEFTEVDTTDILFICSGAFVGIDKTVNARVKKQNIGFGSDLNKKSDQEWQDVIDHSDLISYGLIPELVGRLPNLVTLSSLTVDNMVSILKDSDASIIPQVKKLLEIDNIEVEFSDQYFQDVASIASKNKLGARSLKSIVENSLHNIMFRAPDLRKNGVKRVSFNTYPSKNVDTNPLFLYNNGHQEVDKLYKIRLRG
jgi:ATP-dependent Clp protease ATP-binding subunit ClpX